MPVNTFRLETQPPCRRLSPVVYDPLLVKRIIYTLVTACSRLLSTRRPPLNQSRLMTMYLSQANSKTIYTPRFQETRTRRNGKYSHVRNRS